MSDKELLSEGEIDALMATVSDDSARTGEDLQRPDCQLFDFSTREQALLAQMPALKTLNEKHSLALAQQIQSLYKIAAQVEVENIQVVRLDQAIASIAEPSGINLIGVSPLNGTSFVVLPGELLSFFVDTFFGGISNGRESGPPRKSLTPTEKRVCDVLTETFLRTLKEAWQEKISLAPELLGFESDPGFLTGSAEEELCLQFSFDIKVGEWRSAIDWLVPCAALEPLRLKLGSQSVKAPTTGGSKNWEKHFRRALQAVDLEVSGSFTSGTVSIGEVLRLKAGSIVPLRVPTEVTVYIENQTFSLGEHGVLNGNKSIRITEIIKDEANAL